MHDFSRKLTRRSKHYAVAVFLAVAIGGCSDNSGRVHLSGKVTWNGEPVPAGMIIINPDVSQGNIGPQGMAEIRNGTYDTSTGKGRSVTPGAITVSVHGFDGLNPTEEQPNGNRMFMPFELSTTTPESSGPLDIEVPADIESLRVGTK
jgi:hypothetical protein